MIWGSESARELKDFELLHARRWLQLYHLGLARMKVYDKSKVVALSSS